MAYSPVLNPQPVTVADATASGTITTQNLVPAGAATANSAVAIMPDGRSGLIIQVTGTYTGALSLQGTVNGTTWVTVGGITMLNVNTGALSATIASGTQGIFQTEVSGYNQVRLTALAAVTGTATVSLRATPATPSVAIDAALPAGSNAIGTVSVAASSNLVGDTAFQYRANATGAATAFSLLSPATPAAASVKGTAGRLIGWSLVNTAAALRSVKFWNTASGSVTLGTTAAVWEVDIPAGGRSEINLPGGIAFSTAITVAVTGDKGLTNNTGGLGASDVSGVLFYA